MSLARDLGPSERAVATDRNRRGGNEQHLFQQTNQRSFGTFPLKGAELANALTAAVHVGYRSIDTAQMYGNEAGVGAVLAGLPIPRSEFCITTRRTQKTSRKTNFLHRWNRA